MKLLKDKIAKIEDEHAEETFNEHIETHTQQERDNALLLLGGLRAIDRLTQVLSGEVMSNLIRFEKDKMFESFGFTRFADFLDESPFSPMTKHQFYERKKVFENEGEQLFDVLNGIGMAIQKRKLLGKGNISIDGETVFVKDADGNETAIEINNRSQLLETLTAIADSSAGLRKKLDREKEKVGKVEEKIIVLEEENARIRAYKKAEFTDFHADAQINLASAFKTLEHHAEQLSSHEKAISAPKVFEIIAGLMDGLSAAYNRKSWTVKPKDNAQNGAQPKDATDEFIENFLDAEETENDTELVGMM